MNQEEIARSIDSTLLNPLATEAEIQQLCQDALELNIGTVCVHGFWLPKVQRILQGSQTRTAAVADFPHGNATPLARARQVEELAQLGADEIDFVAPLPLLMAGRWTEVQQDLEGLRKAAGNKITKIILETSAIPKNLWSQAAEIAVATGHDFLKTSTGFAGGGATQESVQALVQIAKLGGRGTQVKASGGIRDQSAASLFLSLGATRLGTSQARNILAGTKLKGLTTPTKDDASSY